METPFRCHNDSSRIVLSANQVYAGNPRFRSRWMSALLVTGCGASNQVEMPKDPTPPPKGAKIQFGAPSSEVAHPRTFAPAAPEKRSTASPRLPKCGVEVLFEPVSVSWSQDGCEAASGRLSSPPRAPLRGGSARLKPLIPISHSHCLSLIPIPSPHLHQIRQCQEIVGPMSDHRSQQVS